ncbi:hypothetical protein [Microtetraspora malaysiensis]|uniref:hypothetical protein n=1 Tax=Microtetraspora malaysiensis TaxID=161358 RepID=UPI0009FC8C6A|nr:hypothetical protein [Microtetraspora malaysiensis]
MKRFTRAAVSLAAPLAAAQFVVGATAPAAAAAPQPVRVPSGVTAGYVVFDRQAGKVIANRQVHHRFRSASVVKVLIAIDYLERRKGAIPAADAALLATMLRGSNDDAATALWRRGGQGKIVQRMARKVGLTDTAPPPAAKPGFWGYTAISALDIARVYRYLLDTAQPRVRDAVLGHLRQAQQCATDGFDQYFGIPRGVPRPWAVKQGWSGYGSVPPVKCVRSASSSPGMAPRGAAGPATTGASATDLTAVTAGPAGLAVNLTAGLAAGVTASLGSDLTVGRTAGLTTGRAASLRRGNAVDFSRPVLHTTGMIGDRFIMVVLTTQPAGASYGSSATRLTALARDLYRSVR